ncbi:FecR domain-containing protein [Saccharicrinis fermentans]|uniref:Fec operon regulator FecR n=1 Tax=Saccharicrinis fermentans DSM 9555 = JCM 21142 TaxID=869213 RepID=W7YK61_9BACT|nr:FecR family protein [Saccharicrinis fermentans]GAF02724.1 fec operon regulator FecR [Saccharicrinis fermentans DSM 9555 = JCM 21142]
MQKSHIDFYIIWKKIFSTTSAEEDRELQKWLNASAKHFKFFYDAEAFHKYGSSFSKKPVDSQIALKKVRSRIFRKLVFRRIAAAAVILFIFSTVTYVLQKDWHTSDELIAKDITSESKSGKQKAILILQDGTTKSLTTKSAIKVQQGQTLLQQSEEGLFYVAGHQKTDKLVYNTLKIPRGGEFFIELSDKSKVWLNSETTLRYPVSFTNKQRVVELTGEAYFEVSKDTKRPFIVISNNHTVQVLGTQFNISSYPEEADIKTTLVQGSVKVKAGDADNVILKSSFQSVYRVEDDVVIAKKFHVGMNAGDFDGVADLIAKYPERFSSPLDVLWYERRVELAGEGDRWFDLVRSGRTASVMGAIYPGVDWNKHIYLPVGLIEQGNSGNTLTAYPDEVYPDPIE